MTRTLQMFGVGFVVIAALVVGYVVGTQDRSHSLAGERGSIPADVDLTPVWTAWELLEDRFVPSTTTDAVTPEDRVWGMIQGLARSYDDPYTLFLPPRENEQFSENLSGAFGGVGIEIGMRDNVLTVIAPLKNTPAYRAGVEPGDKIMAVDGEMTRDVSIDEAVEWIRGPVGTEVELLLARNGESVEVTIVRDTIEIPTSEAELRDDGVFVLSLYNFGATSPDAFRDGLRQFVESGSDKLVIDLRGNPGGFLEAAVDIASWFLPTGKVVVEEDFGETELPEYHRSKGYNVYEEDWNVVVLVDGGSASASEIVAGALQDHGIATLIGTQTFGKGSVQELLDVTDETAIKITIARWLTPKGISISQNGLTPDFVVPYVPPEDDAEPSPDDPLPDNQLDAAVEYLLTGIVTTSTSTHATTTSTDEM